MKGFYQATHILGLFFFFLSYFFYTTPNKFVVGSEGKEVKNWEIGLRRHITLSLEPLVLSVEIGNIIAVPTKYDCVEKGDGCDNHTELKVMRLFYSIPICIGWLTI